MYAHHEAAIARVIARFRDEPGVLAILLAGSLAHGTATGNSDVDIMLVVSDEELAERRAANTTAFSDTPLANYPNGYIDVKYVSPGYLDEVAARGSEPSRFAFKGATVLFSRIEGLEGRLGAASRYPVEVQQDRIIRFAAQLEAWTWMAGEAERKENPYLLAAAVSRVALFGGRMILAQNRMLYPFHKWFLRSLEAAPEKPEGLVELIRSATSAPSADGARAICEAVLGFSEWQRGEIDWPNHFIHDTEQAWLRDAAAVEDL
jgi:hypothetical protein